MPNLADNIEGFVLGDTFRIERDITGIPDGQVISKAWLTVKEEVDNDPSDTVVLFQKVITTAANADGQITEAGVGSFPDRSGHVLFNALPANTFAWENNSAKQWDIQIKLSGGSVNTPFRGTIKGIKGVTNVTT